MFISQVIDELLRTRDEVRIAVAANPDPNRKRGPLIMKYMSDAQRIESAERSMLESRKRKRE